MNKITYLIKCTQTGVYKIGESSNPKNRFRTIKTSNPYVIFIGISPFETEQELHKEYEVYRFSGEWFKFPDYIEPILLSKFVSINEMVKPKELNIEENHFNRIKNHSKYLLENFDIKQVNKFTDIIYKELGKRKYSILLNECDEFWTLSYHSLTTFNNM